MYVLTICMYLRLYLFMYICIYVYYYYFHFMLFQGKIQIMKSGKIFLLTENGRKYEVHYYTVLHSHDFNTIILLF